MSRPHPAEPTAVVGAGSCRGTGMCSLDRTRLILPLRQGRFTGHFELALRRGTASSGERDGVPVGPIKCARGLSWLARPRR